MNYTIYNKTIPVHFYKYYTIHNVIFLSFLLSCFILSIIIVIVTLILIKIKYSRYNLYIERIY